MPRWPTQPFPERYPHASWLVRWERGQYVGYRGQLTIQDGYSHRFVDRIWVCLHAHKTREEAQTCAAVALELRRDHVRP